MAQEASIDPKAKNVSLGEALWIYFGLLVVALILTSGLTVIHQRNELAFLMPPLFPLGLFMAFTPEGIHVSDNWVFVGYAIYALLLGCFVKARRRSTFYALVALYVAILLVNVAGCTQREYDFKMNCSNDKGTPVVSTRSGNAS